MKLFLNYLSLVSLIFIFGLSVSPAIGAMTGTSYRIESDSINSGGIDNSSFGDYQLMDTVGEIAIGDSSSTNFSIRAGYRQLDEASISVSVSAQDIVLSPDLGGVTGGTSTGATDISVITDNPAGYLVSIKASTTPAMQSDSSTIDDYAPAGANPDYNFVLSVGTSVFAFTPEGEDITDFYRDNGSNLCNISSGSDTINRCWNGLSTSAKTIANRSSRTSLSGSTTTIRFSVGIGANRIQPEGLYTATTTVTVLSL